MHSRAHAIMAQCATPQVKPYHLQPAAALRVLPTTRVQATGLRVQAVSGYKPQVVV